MLIQSPGDVRRVRLMRQEAGAVQPELPRVNGSCQRVIRSDRTECGHAFRTAVFRTLKNVLQLADFVAAIDRAGLIIVFHSDLSLARREIDRVTGYGRRQRRKRALPKMDRQRRIRFSEVIGHDNTH